MDTIKRRQISHGGKRIPVELEPVEWEAVEWIAASKGQTDGDWIRDRISVAKVTGRTITITIRAAIAAACMELLGRRSGTPAATGFEQANTPNNDQFQEMIEAAQINGTVDLVGCTVMAGVNESGNVAFYIRNGWRDGLNMTISTPMTPEVWRERMGIDAL